MYRQLYQQDSKYAPRSRLSELLGMIPILRILAMEHVATKGDAAIQVRGADRIAGMELARVAGWVHWLTS
jgi:hypothetical protein